MTYENNIVFVILEDGVTTQYEMVWFVFTRYDDEFSLIKYIFIPSSFFPHWDTL